MDQSDTFMWDTQSPGALNWTLQDSCDLPIAFTEPHDAITTWMQRDLRARPLDIPRCDELSFANLFSATLGSETGLEVVDESPSHQSQLSPVASRSTESCDGILNRRSASRKSSPTAAEWESVKEIIRRFYIENEYTLATVMDIMSKHPHNFHATYVLQDIYDRCIRPTNGMQNEDV